MDDSNAVLVTDFDGGELLCVKEVAPRLGCKPSLVYKYRALGLLPYVQLPGQQKYLFRSEDVEKLVKSCLHEGLLSAATARRREAPEWRRRGRPTKLDQRRRARDGRADERNPDAER